MVLEENHGYSSVIGTTAMPYLNGLVGQYGLATNYYANTHPSIGNYFMLTTGQILTNDDSNCPLTFPVSADNVVRELLLKGKTRKVYAEDLPAVGSLSCGSGNYVARHNPFPYFTDVQNSSVQRQNLVPFQDPNVGFAHDLVNGTLPDYSFIVPNLCNDAHDCSLNTADSWLETNIDPYVQNSAFTTNGLLLVTFDESGGDNTYGGGRVYLVAAGPHVKPGYQSTFSYYQHQSTLQLTMAALGIASGYPGAATGAPSMAEFFGTSTPTVSVSISPTSATVASGDTQPFTATVTGTTNTGVTWSATKGTIASSGLYTAPTVTSNTTATVTATSVADATESASAAVTITAPGATNADFSLSATPTSQAVSRGATASYAVTVIPSGSFSGIVMLDVSGLPPGSIASFSPLPVNTSGSSTLTVDTNMSNNSRNYTLTISGTSGNLTRMTSVSLTTAQ